MRPAARRPYDFGLAKPSINTMPDAYTGYRTNVVSRLSSRWQPFASVSGWLIQMAVIRARIRMAVKMVVQTAASLSARRR